MVLTASFGHISGAHFNPSVTVGVLIAGEIQPIVATLYVVVQLLGGKHRFISAWIIIFDCLFFRHCCCWYFTFISCSPSVWSLQRWRYISCFLCSWRWLGSRMASQYQIERHQSIETRILRKSLYCLGHHHWILRYFSPGYCSSDGRSRYKIKIRSRSIDHWFCLCCFHSCYVSRSVLEFDSLEILLFVSAVLSLVARWIQLVH